MQINKEGIPQVSLSSHIQTTYTQIKQNIHSVTEVVVWLGRKFYKKISKNRMVETIARATKKIFTTTKKELVPKVSVSLEKTPPELEKTLTVLPAIENKKPLVRKIPPISLFDTTIWVDGVRESIHGQGNVFSDEEIIEVCVLSEERIEQKVPITTVKKGGKTVIQQQGTRGCTAAVVMMLVQDHGKELDARYLRRTNLGNEKTMCAAITRAGLKPLLRYITPTLSRFRDAILQNGPAIVVLSLEEMGGHVVIVDEINETLDRVTLRDPYHGWAIIISGKTFLEQHPGKTIIQIS